MKIEDVSSEMAVLEAVKGLCSEMTILVNKFLELLGAWAMQSHLHQEAKLQNGRAAVLAPHGAFGYETSKLDNHFHLGPLSS